LSLSAIQEHQRSGKGRFVNYNQLPGVVWDKVLPQDFGISVEQDAIERMTRVAAVYSKGRGVKANQEWQEDSTKKQSTASKEVVDAVRVFLADTYDQMEALSLEQN
jgi:glyoxylate carboligase